MPYLDSRESSSSTSSTSAAGWPGVADVVRLVADRRAPLVLTSPTAPRPVPAMVRERRGTLAERPADHHSARPKAMVVRADRWRTVGVVGGQLTSIRPRRRGAVVTSTATTNYSTASNTASRTRCSASDRWRRRPRGVCGQGAAAATFGSGGLQSADRFRERSTQAPSSSWLSAGQGRVTGWGGRRSMRSPVVGSMLKLPLAPLIRLLLVTK